MFALSKNDPGIRRIAVGNTLRRFATKVRAKSISASTGEAIRPVQLGVSSKCGCEAAAPAVRRYQEEALHRPVIFRVDMAIAFNSPRFWLPLEREHRPCTVCCGKLTRGQPIFSMVIRTCVGNIYSAGRSL